MPGTDEKPQINTPWPTLIWIVAMVDRSQIGKRVIGTWELPKQFSFGSRFMENLVANLLWGLPVLIALIAATIWVNRKRAE